MKSYRTLNMEEVFKLASGWRHWLRGPMGVIDLVDRAIHLGYAQGRDTKVLRDRELTTPIEEQQND